MSRRSRGWLGHVVVVGALASGAASCKRGVDAELREPDTTATEHTSPPPRDAAAVPVPEGCIVRAMIPGEARLGSYPSIDVEVHPPIEYYGGANPPRLIIELDKPDGEHTRTVVELLYQPVCAYCLPAKGSGGCDHSCTWEPFEGDSYGISRELKVAGEYRVTLSLDNYACALEGGAGVLVVHERD